MSTDKIEIDCIHHVALAVADFEKALQFYTVGLGFKSVASWGEGNKQAALLDIGNGSHLEIFANGKAESETKQNFVHLAFSTANPDSAFKNSILAGARAHMKPKNVILQSEPQKVARIAFVKGINGELLEFFKFIG